MPRRAQVVVIILDLHRLSLEQYGGGDGVRDIGLLESALAQPRAAFGGEYAHNSLYAMAAAYLFHIIDKQHAIREVQRIATRGSSTDDEP